jgi:hypothetical protein
MTTEEKGCYFCVGCEEQKNWIKKATKERMRDFQFTDGFTNERRFIGCDCKDFKLKKNRRFVFR